LGVLGEKLNMFIGGRLTRGSGLSYVDKDLALFQYQKVNLDEPDRSGPSTDW